MWIVFVLIFVISFLISYFWVRAIDNMKKNHPDYKGEDFINWDINKEDKD